MRVNWPGQYYIHQRWSRGHKARPQGQGHKKNPRSRPRTALPRIDPLKVKNRNARNQDQGPRAQAQVFSKKKGLQKSFSGDLKKKVFKNFFQEFSSKKRLPKFFFRRSTKFQQFKKKCCVLEPRTGKFSRV